MLLASQFNRPTKAVHVIALSHLARPFVPHTNIDDMLADPDPFIAGKGVYAKPFEIAIEASWRTWKFQTGMIHSIDEDLAFAWIGVDNSRFKIDYDATGLVYFNVPPDVQAALEYKTKTGEKLSKALEDKLRVAVDQHRELSNQRVITHCKRIYNTMIKSREIMRTHNKANEAPNDMELLIANILKDDVRKAAEKRKRAMAAFEESMEEINRANDILRA